MSDNSFNARATLKVADRSLEIFRLDALQASYDVARLPFSLKILLENLLRHEDGETVRRQDIEAPGQLGCQGGTERGDRLHAGSGADAGLHRGSGGR